MLIRKNKVIIDIRDLNKITKLNIYFIFLQINIIVFVVECLYISTRMSENIFSKKYFLMNKDSIDKIEKATQMSRFNNLYNLLTFALK